MQLVVVTNYMGHVVSNNKKEKRIGYYVDNICKATMYAVQTSQYYNQTGFKTSELLH